MFDWTIVFGRASQGNLLTRPGQLAGVSLLGSASRQQHHLISTIVYHNIREDQLLQPTLSHEDLRSIRCCSIRGSKVAIKRKADEGDFERRVRQATGDLRHEADKHLQHANEANQRAVVAEAALVLRQHGHEEESIFGFKNAGDNMKPHSPRCQCERTRRAQAVHLHCLLPEGRQS